MLVSALAQMNQALTEQSLMSAKDLRIFMQKMTSALAMKAGKMANLVVLNQDIFVAPEERIHSIDTESVMFEGKWIKGEGED